VALWQLLPEETPDNALLAGWTRCLHVPLRLWPSMVRMELQYDKAHEAVTSDIGSYYYCGFIGTHPEVRGKGYGSMLLKHITDKADSEGRWCLLEATSERSQALYARHGFETYQTYHVTKHAPPMYMMKRAPLTAAAPKQAHKSIAVLAANKTAAAPESSGEDSLELIPAVHAGQAVSAV
jgi:GNAT superfamily N-acetyltransferase